MKLPDRSRLAARWRWRTSAAVLVLVIAGASCGGAPETRPQWGVEPAGERFAPLRSDAAVKLYFEGEPEESYRVVGKVTATCPQKQWVGGREQKGRPVCIEGVRQAARKLGAQAVIEIHTKRTLPEWDPERPWLIMHGVAVRVGR
jgi:hypothetical protein